ncbi:MAG: hypothetical protein JJE13_08390 [Thermoleophilia bacterium]|nr:hypothetical protein [Thermoleophilia bacterium]
MALSEDSRTLLQLLLGRGKSYNDISGLLGIDESEVRDRAHQALTEINGSDPDTDVNLTDYLLGQSDPIARADVARELADNPEAADTASSLSDQLRLLVPGADLPKVAGGKVTPAKRGLTSRSAPSKRSRPAKSDGESRSGVPLTGSQRRMIAGLLFAALLVTVLILFLSGAIGGGDDDSGKTPADAESVQAILQPVGSQTGTGKVQLGQTQDQFAARLEFTELAPSEDNSSYVLWADGSVGSFPLDETEVKKDGTISKTILIPAVVLCSIATDIFPDFKLSRLDASERQDVLAQTNQAVSGKLDSLPDYKGKTVFEGPVSMDQSLKDSVSATCTAPQSTGTTQP